MTTYNNDTLVAAIASGSTIDEATILNLRSQLAEANTLLASVRERLGEAREQHASDIATIGNKLVIEADYRGWCAEFDTIVNELNSDLHVTLPTREREYTVTLEVTVVINVTATSEEDARSQAEDTARELERELDLMDGIGTTQWPTSYHYEVEED